MAAKTAFKVAVSVDVKVPDVNFAGIGFRKTIDNLVILKETCPECNDVHIGFCKVCVKMTTRKATLDDVMCSNVSMLKSA